MIGALRKRVHELARHLLHEHTAPSRMALAVLLGCVVGCTPLFGFHLLVCIALAWLLGLNQLVVYGAANISIPPMIPFIGFASVQLGERLLHGRWLALRLTDFTWKNAPALGKTFFLDWLAGGLAVGGAVGLVAGSVTWVLLERRRARRLAGLVAAGGSTVAGDPAAGGDAAVVGRVAVAGVATVAGDPVVRAIRAASARYDGLRPRFKMYARMKYRLDPCYRAIAPLVPAGAFTVDLGTGLGMLPVVLGMLGEGRRALGVEWDAAKVACGVHASRGLDGIEVVEGDVRAFALPPCDVITLVDMLHYYDADVQRALLARAHAALRPGGRLLIREGDRARAGGARWTRGVEKLVTRLGWNRGPAVRFRPIAELRADLEALGLRVRVDEVAGRLHPGNVLLVAER